MRKIAFLAFFSFSYLVVQAQKQLFPILEVPGKSEICIIDEKGKSVLPSGRTLTPAGQMVRITHDPFGLAISPDGKKAVSLHNGVFSIIQTADLQATRVPSYDKTIVSPLSNGSFLGVAFNPDNKTIYLSGGDNGAVIVYDIEQMQRIDSISLNGEVNGKKFEDSFTSDLLYQNGELLILDRGNFRMVRYDLGKRKIKVSIPVGRQPFGLAVSPDRQKAFVANVGMYVYPLIEGITEENYNDMLISRHPYADNSKESREGTIIDGKVIPGVGDPLSPEAMSVFTIDLKTNKVIDKYKTGYQIGEMVEDAEVVGGASPNSIAVGKQYLYVTNATNDNIAVIDHNKRKILKHIPISIDKRIDRYRGSLPFGITLSKDEKTLYVALLGMNAVAVIDIKTEKTLGLIPTGWGPSRVKLSADEKEMYVISCRGLGAGPNGGSGFIAPPQGTYVGDIQ